MLPAQIVCAICKRASEGHDRNGACLLLRRDRQAAPMTPQGYAALRGMVRRFEGDRAMNPEEDDPNDIMFANTFGDWDVVEDAAQLRLDLPGLQRLAEFEPNIRIVFPLGTGERLGVTRFVRRAYGRTSKPYAGLEEFAWLYEVWTPALKQTDRQWPHVRPTHRGWRTLPLGAPGEAEALRLLAGESYADVVASRAPVRGVGA